jgi:co-chaperonin GroES (HSP10)
MSFQDETDEIAAELGLKTELDRSPHIQEVDLETIPTDFPDFQTGKTPPNNNSIAIIAGKLAVEALNNKVMVVEDEFRMGYECSLCGGGEGISQSKIKCDECSGTGTRAVRGTDINKKCSTCEGSGEVVCPQCQGKGGLLIAPDTAKRRPSTGRIVSIGPEVKKVEVGDYVLYTNFAGTSVNFKNFGVLRTMSENEIIGRLYSAQEVKFGQAVVI